MKDLELLISSMVTTSYKKDEAVQCIGDIFKNDRVEAVCAYCRLCEILLSEGKTLSDHLSAITVMNGNKLFDEYFRTHSELLRYNIRHDFSVLTELSQVTAYELVGMIRERFGIPESFVFPMYENGNSSISFEEAEKYLEEYGSSFFANNKAFIYTNNSFECVEHFDRVKLSDLKNYDTQRNAVIQNTLRLIQGKKCSNVLLYGDRGTGKSSTVKAVVNEYQDLRIVLVPKESLMKLYEIYDKIRGLPIKFIIFFDDMSFEEGDPAYYFMKQALEGSVNVKPDNCAIYATTNRRHIIRETSSERADEHNAADARDEKASLADRFGMYITFMMPDKNAYLDIVRKIAQDRKTDMDPAELDMLAERFAVRKGNRSPRTARQFIDSIDNGSGM